MARCQRVKSGPTRRPHHGTYLASVINLWQPSGMPVTTPEVALADGFPGPRPRKRGAVGVAALIGVAATVFALALIAAVFDVHVARVKTIDVYVTAVDADRTSIGYANSVMGDTLGTYDLRGLTLWADGVNGAWIPVGPGVEHGRPTCIPPGSYGAKVRLTLVTAMTGGRDVIDHVARLRCLSPAFR